jgi:hypothetical protein
VRAPPPGSAPLRHSSEAARLSTDPSPTESPPPAPLATALKSPSVPCTSDHLLKTGDAAELASRAYGHCLPISSREESRVARSELRVRREALTRAAIPTLSRAAALVCRGICGTAVCVRSRRACDVPARWACRTSVCHSCETAVLSGTVAHELDPGRASGGRKRADLLLATGRGLWL